MSERSSVIVENSDLSTRAPEEFLGDYAIVTENAEEANYRLPRIPIRWYTSPNLTNNPVVGYAEEIADEMHSHLTTPMTSTEDLSPEAARPFNLTEFEYSMRSAMPGYNRNQSVPAPPNDDHSIVGMLTTQEGAIMIAIAMLLGE